MTFHDIDIDLLDSDDDWIEDTREALLPTLDKHIRGKGDTIGVPMYSTGYVTERAYVGRVPCDSEELETVLDDIGFRRNPVAAFKSDPEGETSDGSWRLLPSQSAELRQHRQLHVTLFDVHGEDAVDVYAHVEWRWDSYPLRHLRSEDMDAKLAVELTSELLSDAGYAPKFPEW